jgi:hypothetical protein
MKKMTADKGHFPVFRRGIYNKDRPPSAPQVRVDPRGLVMEGLLEVLVAFVVILSLFLLGASIYSYRVTGNRKMLFVMGAFILFTMKGIIMALSLFTDVVELDLDASLVLLDLFILITLYLLTMTK